MAICDPDKSIGMLVSDIGRLLRKTFDERIREETGITGAQWNVLVQLNREDGLTQSMLADLLEIEGSSLIRHIDNLQEQGLIRRRIDAADRRTNRIFLTPAAEDLFDRAQGMIEKFRSELLAGIAPQDLDKTLACLGKIKQNAQSLQQDKTREKKKWAKS